MLWDFMSGVIVLATLGLSIYNAVNQTSVNVAIEAGSQAQQNSVIIANEALHAANVSAEEAGEAVQVAELANNITATAANNQAVQDLIELYQFCREVPTATFNGTTCQDILGSPLPNPEYTSATSAAPLSIMTGSGHKLEPSFLMIVGVMSGLMAIVGL